MGADDGVAPRPVGAEGAHAGSVKGIEHLLAGEGGFLVVLARHAPGGGVVDENGVAFAERGLHGGVRPGLPAAARTGRVACCSGAFLKVGDVGADACQQPDQGRRRKSGQADARAPLQAQRPQQHSVDRKSVV